MIIIDEKKLFFCKNTSDKEYHIQLTSDDYGDIFSVTAQWGRRGSTLQSGEKIHDADCETARKLFTKIVNEKLGKGYEDRTGRRNRNGSRATITDRLEDGTVIVHTPDNVTTGSGFAAYDPNRNRDLEAMHGVRVAGNSGVAGYHGVQGVTGSQGSVTPTLETITTGYEFRIRTQPVVSVEADIDHMQNSVHRALGLPAVKNHTPAVLPRRLNLEPEESDITFVPHLLLPVIDEAAMEQFLEDNNYCIQEKKDGKHFTIKRIDGEVFVRNKLGKIINYPEALVEALGGIEGDIHLDAEGIGMVYHVFDIMHLDNKDLTGRGYEARHSKLKEIEEDLCCDRSEVTFKIVPLHKGKAQKKAFYDRMMKKGKEGVVFKKLDAPYRSAARNSDMVKFKFYATLSARICAGRTGKNSIGLELLEKDQWVKIGNCTVSANKMFSIRVGQVAEIKYLYGYKGGSLYQPSFKEIRDDVLPGECLMSQVKYKSEED